MSLNDPGRQSRGLLFPEIRFYTNDAWPLIRGVAQARGVPILLMDRYSRGALYILNIPDNPGDLYELPQPLLKVLRSYLQADMPVRLDAPDHVSLFSYDNGTFIMQSFRGEPVTVTVSLAGLPAQIRDLVSSEAIAAETVKSTPAGSHADAPVRSEFRVELAPHSYRVIQYTVVPRQRIAATGVSNTAWRTPIVIRRPVPFSCRQELVSSDLEVGRSHLRLKSLHRALCPKG